MPTLYFPWGFLRNAIVRQRERERERERDEWILSLLYRGEIMSSRYGGLSRIGLALEFRLTIRLVEMNYECDILIQT